MTRKSKVKADVIAKISLNFPKDLWMDLKRRALEDEETVTDILVRLAAMYVRSGKKRRSALS
jgi:hypothetical protein